MKKIVLTFVWVLGLSLVQVNAQGLTLSGGVKAEANMSNHLLSDLDNQKSKMKVGATVGGFLKMEFTENFALQPELLFHYKMSEWEIGNQKLDNEYWGMEIPIYAVGQMNLGNGKGYVGIGPYVALGFDSRTHPGGNDLYDNNYFQRWDFGAGIMLGYEFSNKIQVNAGYKIGFIDNLDEGKKDATMLNEAVSLGIGYRF